MIRSLLLAVMLVACSPSEPLPGNAAAAEQRAGAMENSMDGDRNASAAADEGVAGLPFSHGRSFRTLDEYLAHLERHAAPIDQPWWREIRPGVYEHVKRMPGASREVATREELMKRFGFTK
jgi:hypothetical protein